MNTLWDPIVSIVLVLTVHAVDMCSAKRPFPPRVLDLWTVLPVRL